MSLTGDERSKDTAWVSGLMLGEAADREWRYLIRVILSEMHGFTLRYKQRPAWK